MAVRYFIAQHVADPFRMEARNVGVIAEIGERRAAYFVGETEPGRIDGRSIRGFKHPEVYRQWVSHWRRKLNATEELGQLASANGANYRLIRGGDVFDVGEDSVEDVAQYLFARLVGGTDELLEQLSPEAAEGPEEAVESRGLATDVEGALGARSLIAEDEANVFVPHPVRKRPAFVGRSQASYTPAFAQENGRVYVMDVVDFTRKKKKLAREHAGSVAYMFSDLGGEMSGRFTGITIIRAEPADLNNADVDNGLRMIKSESEQVVNWLERSERESFLQEREAVALDRHLRA